MKIKTSDIPERILHNANRFLLEKRGMPKAGPHMSILRNWWLEEYNILIQDRWDTMMFKSEQDYIMFLLRWS